MELSKRERKRERRDGEGGSEEAPRAPLCRLALLNSPRAVVKIDRAPIRERSYVQSIRLTGLLLREPKVKSGYHLVPAVVAGVSEPV